MINDSDLRMIDQPSPVEVEEGSHIWYEAESLRISSAPYDSYLEDQRRGFIETVSRTDAWLTLAVRNFEVVGLVGGLAPTPEQSAAYLGYIAVAVRHRCQGVGQALLKRATARVGELGTSTMLLTVHESNIGARRLYEKAGWRSTGRQETTRIDQEPLVEYLLNLST